MSSGSNDGLSPLPYDHTDITIAFSARTLQRALAYAHQGRVGVLTIAPDAKTIEAAVLGSGGSRYAVVAAVRTDRGRTSLGGACSCPVGVNCKHVAAVLFAALRERESPGRFEVPVERRALQPPPDPVRARVMAWLGDLERASVPRGSESVVGDERVAYVFASKATGAHDRFPVRVIVERLTKAGRWAKIRDTNAESLIAASARAIVPDDSVVGRMLKVYETAYSQRGEFIDDTVRRIVATGRAYYETTEAPPLVLGPARPGDLAWRVEPDGTQRASIAFDDDETRLLAARAAWYVHVPSGTAGPIESTVPRRLLETLLDAPPVEPAEVPHVRRSLATLAERASLEPHASIPAPADIVERAIEGSPLPVLRLRAVRGAAPSASWRYRYAAGDDLVDIAELTFAYGEAIVEPYDPAQQLRRYDGVELIVVRRSIVDEQRAVQRLIACDLVPADAGANTSTSQRAAFTFAFEDDHRWREFAHRGLAALRSEGWRIEIDPSFRRRVVDVDDDAAWSAQATEDAGGWFDLALGLQIEGRRYDLVPILRELLQRDAIFSDPNALARMAAGQPVYITLPGSTATFALPGPRVSAILTTLVELHDHDNSRAGAALRLPRTRASALGELEAGAGLPTDAPRRLRELAERLRTFEGIEHVPVPKSFRGELRGYQRDGLDWLQFLSRYGFGGILADDMGLGKSVQTLAHLLREKEARRMQRPALLVVPTSLVFNWCAEAARFAPKLRVLALHGFDRAARFAEIDAHDLIVTTYALLVRDTVLHERDWHALILDEAQAIKNPLSKAAQIAMTLRAEHRLILTGTPVENHLGDLWSLFSIALPGALGDRQTFGRLFRTPIEKRGDALRAAALAQRIRPFLLRRTKDAVAKELPEKTEIVRRVDLGDQQRDLYETIRVAMHHRVRDEIEKRGLARSQIVILDALLKLRQVCCDPRLLPPQLRKTAPSAKLELLLEMLPEMVEEGRRVLVFSQFTSMLDLLEPELRKRDIPFVVLTGQTKDRASVVERFQAGEVPVFLISLKAGGTGLNLTAADTVIHYDPWWNPAVERQATDRAHRIGQLQHVFVYKLIGAGTLEEKILDLQERKAKLAAAIFAETDAGSARISADDVEMLFAPMA